MANLKAKNADNSDVFIKATGAGTDLDPLIVEQAVSVSSSALPTGAATSANQTTHNTKLDSVIAGTDNLKPGVTLTKSLPTLTTTSGTVLASNASRRSVTLYAPKTNTVDVWIDISGGTADADSIALSPGDLLPFAIGEIPTNAFTGRSASSTAKLLIYEGV